MNLIPRHTYRQPSLRRMMLARLMRLPACGELGGGCLVPGANDQVELPPNGGAGAWHALASAAAAESGAWVPPHEGAARVVAGALV